MDLVLVCAPGATIPPEIASRAEREGRRVLRSRLAPPGYLYECDLDAEPVVPDEWVLDVLSS
jgi:hypothetical protein